MPGLPNLFRFEQRPSDFLLMMGGCSEQVFPKQGNCADSDGEQFKKVPRSSPPTLSRNIRSEYPRGVRRIRSRNFEPIQAFQRNARVRMILMSGLFHPLFF